MEENIFGLYLRSSSKRVINYRKFEKIGTFLSKLGGLFSLLYTALFLIAGYYNRNKLILKLANN